jgi:regulatory protein
MTVLSVKTTENSKTGATMDRFILRIALSDGSTFSFKNAYVPPPYSGEDLCVPGREISAEEAEALRFAAACFRTERAALRLTARAEQHRTGITRKLESRGHRDLCIRAALDQLSALNIINDRRYALLWLQSRIARGTSPRKLTQALRNRGISREDTAAVLESVLDLDTESALLRAYLEKTRRHPRPAPPWADPERHLKQSLRQEGISPTVLDLFREEGAL